jgi:hypothetical protein
VNSQKKIKKKMLFFFFLAFGIATNCVDISRDALLDCFSTHIDTNHDGNITYSEVSVVTDPFFFRFCDINMDGVLNMLDWNHPVSCCEEIDRPCIYKVCNECFIKFNWVGN